MARDGSSGQAPPEAPMGTRLIASTPPPMARSDWPAMIWPAAMLQASSPVAQKRLIWMPGTVSAKPAFSTAARAMSEPCSPTGSTQPMTTSSSERGVEFVAVADGLDRLGGELERGDPVQGAVLFAPAARRAHRVINVAVGHGRRFSGIRDPYIGDFAGGFSSICRARHARRKPGGRAGVRRISISRDCSFPRRNPS